MLDTGEPKASGKSLPPRVDPQGGPRPGAREEDRQGSSATRAPRRSRRRSRATSLRVTGKSRDDLQAVQALLKQADLDVALQFVNYR
ncbi:hypothetical protein GCM10025868_31470 [Angustibacter aerolatus]|uniref:Uncharacterized protein n=1 Tax=Angustibacter aerolatus TaxID=1162965 RepID=A0ABQ6JI45_9ACTN|nr:hypothetical protein GCM10025868_31470 [Angustibacter aerolatus]